MKEMTHSWADDTKVPSRSNSVSSSEVVLPQFPAQSNPRHGRGNVFHLLALREISPRTKHSSKRLWGEAPKSRISCFGPRCKVTDARQCLISWVEAESWRHLSAKYCSLVPPPRSTIAAAFSLDGKTLASTHGDHTVKIIDFQTGSCLKVLSGHRRTPWVVRFHPVHPEILASGSLDHEVRLWDANTSDCIGSRNFYRPIASIAFHALGELLAVASGHKLYIWHYNRRGESSPTVVLKTRRSLRAVHFHPHGAPFLLTAEVNDLDSPDCPVTVATSPGYLHYPTPSVLYANGRSSVRPSLEAKVPLVPFPCLFWRTFVKEGGRTSLQHGNGAVGSSNGQQHDYFVSPMEVFPGIPSSSNPVPEDTMVNCVVGEMENAISDSVGDTMETNEEHPLSGSQQSDPHRVEKLDAAGNLSSTIPQVDQVSQIPIRQSRRGNEAMPAIYPSNLSEIADLQMPVRSVEVGQLHRFFAFDDPASWELPFLQGWLMGQTHAGLHPVLPINDAPQGHWFGSRGAVSDVLESDLLATRNVEASLASSANATSVGQSRGTGRSGSRHRSRSRFTAPTGSGEDAAYINIANDDTDPQPSVGITESELGTSLAATAAAELPCTVKLRLWPHDIQNPCAPLDAETCRLTVPHAVLCSEMGAHFSPCGRFLAACVACVLPHMELDPGFQSQVHHDISGFATSPTRHPVSAHQVMYELRIYSLEEATFGSVLTSRAIRAAHCLTSIQFSPTSDHILLAYGRRHSSLLRSFVVDGETATPIYTNLEVYRVSDMELVGVIPSAEDEVNVACFHPLAGGGLVYGTKEGRLRILQYDGSRGIISTGTNSFLEENMLEVQTYALEC